MNDSVPSLRLGDFECSYDPTPVLDELRRDLHQAMQTEQVAEKLSSVAIPAGVADISSNRTCLTCLSHCPTNVLPCDRLQHTICETCLRRFGSGSNLISAVEVKRCPLGCRLRKSPWTIRLKPETAGTRILSLDGGGVRGVIELRILKKVLKEVGHDIPIQELFDLVIGTSTGGIIALGIFKMNWTVDEALEKFKSLSQEAFHPRWFLRDRIFRNAAQLFCTFRYQTDGIEEALKKAFLGGPLFGHYQSAIADHVKVGVVAALQHGQHPSLFANYSRDPSGPGDYLQREEDTADDLTTWQAARSTSAAPIYFQPYHHSPTRRTYVDGAIVRNNPVRVADEENRLIWRDAKTRPDIILSVGTGIQVQHPTTARVAATRTLRAVQAMIPKGIRTKFITSVDMLKAVLDCEREWKDFVQSQSHDPQLVRNCHRLDVALSDKLPKIDEVNTIQSLEYSAQSYLEPGNRNQHYPNQPYESAHHHIQAVARRLVAALFYFDPDHGSLHHGVNQGTIRCRLSPDMRSQFAALTASQPAFRFREWKGNGNSESWDVIHRDHFDGVTFSSPVEFFSSPGNHRRSIEVCFKRKSIEWEPISGY
ncbi:MAG: hypothetical protein M1823_004763 [Watsoniomyces obsoletus]|nr:MAG: hypothetical protein M1823_004763 [Watsoniomyces obsoletus]